MQRSSSNNGRLVLSVGFHRIRKNLNIINFPGCPECLGCPEKPEVCSFLCDKLVHVFTIFNRVAVWGLESEYIQFVVDEELKIIPLVCISIEFQ